MQFFTFSNLNSLWKWLKSYNWGYWIVSIKLSCNKISVSPVCWSHLFEALQTTSTYACPKKCPPLVGIKKKRFGGVVQSNSIGFAAIYIFTYLVAEEHISCGWGQWLYLSKEHIDKATMVELNACAITYHYGWMDLRRTFYPKQLDDWVEKKGWRCLHSTIQTKRLLNPWCSWSGISHTHLDTSWHMMPLLCNDVPGSSPPTCDSPPFQIIFLNVPLILFQSNKRKEKEQWRQVGS